MNLHDIGVTALIVFGGALLAIFGVAAKKLADWIEPHVHNAWLAAAYKRLDYAALEAVKSIEQDVVNAVRDPVTGKISQTAGADAKAAAIQRMKGILGPSGISTIMSVLGYQAPLDLENLLANKIESEVLTMKIAKSAGTATGLAALKPALTAATGTVMVKTTTPPAPPAPATGAPPAGPQ